MSENFIYRLLAVKFNISYMPLPITKGIIEILKEFYTREEAWLLVLAPLIPSSSRVIATLQFKNHKKVDAMLRDMFKRGLLVDVSKNDNPKYQMAPFLPGVVEMQFMKGEDSPESRRLAKKLYDVIEETSPKFLDALEGMDSSFARVIPVNHGFTHENKTLQYEDVRSIINNAKKYAIYYCHCRTQKYLAGEKVCDVPRETCMALDFTADFMIRSGIGRETTREEMLEILEDCEKHNLVHMADNAKSGFSFICNCCGCCCGVLTSHTKIGRKAPVIKSSLIVNFDSEKCTDCAKCTRACQVGALSRINKVTVFSENRCLGCGECIDKCPEEALSLVPRADWKEPEETFGHMVADMMTRRLKSGTKIPFKKMPLHSVVVKFVNKINSI